MGDQWSFKPGDKYKSTRRLIHLLVDVVGKGGNFLLNVGPQPDGKLPPPAVERMLEIGQWLKLNGEAIYGTRPFAPYKEGNVVFTQKAGTIYAICLAAEGTDNPPPKILLSSVKPAPESRVRMLGLRKPLDWKLTPDGDAEIQLPTQLKNSKAQHAWVLKFRVSP